MQCRLADIAMAIAAYRAEHRQLPASLAALRPGYLRTLPDDLIASGRLAYRREGGGYTLTSTGWAFGGDSVEDLVVRMRQETTDAP